MLSEDPDYFRNKLNNCIFDLNLQKKNESGNQEFYL